MSNSRPILRQKQGITLDGDPAELTIYKDGTGIVQVIDSTRRMRITEAQARKALLEGKRFVSPVFARPRPRVSA